ncbi:MAG: FkbM family methyltransferase [Candidatus Aminicenantes bacterium]|nr:FkbM family methyltransferase [Candidatus Aminicenantes bacterium]
MLVKLLKKARWMARQRYSACCRLMMGAKQVPPNYVFRDRFSAGSVAIDVGTGCDPDFSKHLMTNYNMECFAVDPTLKHAAALRQLETEQPLFHYLPLAVGPRNGAADFHESQVNVSGSFLKQHRNIVNDPVETYPVEMVTLAELLRRVAKRPVGIVKLDLEGYEYGVLFALDKAATAEVPQMIVEFHHDTVAGISWQETARAIRHVRSLGFKSFVYNGRDCLFYR